MKLLLIALVWCASSITFVFGENQSGASGSDLASQGYKEVPGASRLGIIPNANGPSVFGVDYKGLRDNGQEWFGFGAGVVASAVEARLISLGDNKDETIVLNEQHGLEKVKKWVLDNCRARWNFSPVTPHSGAFICEKTLILYSSLKAHNDRDTLVIIPLAPMTLGVSTEEAYNKKIEELKKLLGETTPAVSEPASNH
jgi:hypothetical protein